jgi:WD40 repeat protein
MDRVASWSLSPDGSLLASASRYGRVRLWALPVGNWLKDLNGRTDGEWIVVCPAPDGNGGRPGTPDSAANLVAASQAERIHLWRLPETEVRQVLEGHSQPLTALEASTDGRLLASASLDRTVQVWQLPDGLPLSALPSGTSPIKTLALHPHGDFLAAASGEAIRLWVMDDLGRFLLAAAAHLDVPALTQAEASLGEDSSWQVERQWLAFTQALVRWRRRYDVELEEAMPRISLGEFDIELEG